MRKIKTYDEFIGELTGISESSSGKSKNVSGFREAIEIVGIGKMKGKFDTGNTAYSAIICKDYTENDGKVKFTFDGKKEYEYHVEKHIGVWHLGKLTKRPVIKVDIIFNGVTYKDELVDLKIADKWRVKNNGSRFLVCKKFMEKANIIIDPSKDYKLSDENEIDHIKKKKKKVNESSEENPVSIVKKGTNDAIDIDFKIGDDIIGGAIITNQYIDGIESEYSDSVEDFDSGIFRKFDSNQKIYNLEDFWINKDYRGKGYSKFCLERMMEEFNDKQMVLRAFPDGGVDEETLVRIYSQHGFVVLQPTKNDGTIMGKYIK